MFYERVSFSCDRRSVHGWLLTYPIAERQFYDAIVEDMHRSYRYGTDRRLALQRQRPPAGRRDGRTTYLTRRVALRAYAKSPRRLTAT